MSRAVYDVAFLIAAVLFATASLAIGWSVLRDRRAAAGAHARSRSAVALELLAWAVPTILMVALFVAALGAQR